MADIEVTTTIPDAVVDKFRVAFLRKKPVPLDRDGEPTMNDKQWIEKCIKEYLIRIYKKGQRQLAVDGVDQGKIFE
jgi:hypothetical protein